MEQLEYLNNYINNSLMTQKFEIKNYNDVRTFPSRIKNFNQQTNEYDPYHLETPSGEGILDMRHVADKYKHLSTIPDSDIDIRNVFKNYGYSAEQSDTNNKYIKKYGKAHFEPHSKPEKGEDIVFE